MNQNQPNVTASYCGVSLMMWIEKILFGILHYLQMESNKKQQKLQKEYWKLSLENKKKCT